jgi:Icc-related predicted phosphoesterase
VPGRPGNKAVRDLLDKMPPMLVCCGHHHWQGNEMDELDNGTQVLNVDAKAYLIVSDDIKLTGGAS